MLQKLKRALYWDQQDEKNVFVYKTTILKASEKEKKRKRLRKHNNNEEI